ncbi:MAG: Fpg/Nei family DNA glycosylase [Actinobacteria bacterium]|nr:Fpg/Nei family DNA glycosylase [Actinomycetota bacterium]
MPELPELEALARGLTSRVAGRVVTSVTVWQPAVVKTADPAIGALEGERIVAVRRRGKFVCIEAGGLTLVVHLMRSGRLGLHAASIRRPGRAAALALGMDDGRELRLREAATAHRMSASLLHTRDVARHDPLARLGPEPIGLDAAEWRARLGAPRGQLRRALRDGRRVAGIGRAYASDILWTAKLAPFTRTDRLTDRDWEALARAADLVLTQALDRALASITTDLPTRETRVTLVHAHFREPCLRCGSRLERVSFTDDDVVYCPTCQTNGRVYRDRRISRLLGRP